LFFGQQQALLRPPPFAIDQYRPSPPSNPPKSIDIATKSAKLFLKRNAKGEYINTKVSINERGHYELTENLISAEEFAAFEKKQIKITSDIDEIITKKDKVGGEQGGDDAKGTQVTQSFYIVHYHNPAEGANWQSNTYGDILDAGTPKPAGATTQWLSFMMNAQNYFPQNDHLAFMLRFATSNTAPLYGLGSIFGHNEYWNNGNSLWYGSPPYYNQLAKGCTNYSSQKEFFLGAANVVSWPSCVQGGLTDNTWYYFEILASDNSQVAVSIHEWSYATNSWQQKTRIGEPPFSANPTAAYFNNIPGATSWTPTTIGIALFNAFSTKPELGLNNPTGKVYADPWYIIFDQVNRGWY
jgi:hypothetical protein